MNATPIRPGPDEREVLARLLPQPAERDLPTDRHRQLQEFVMSHIQQDVRPAARGPRRSPRRLAQLTAALAVGVAAAVAAAVGTGVLGGAGSPPVISGDGASTGSATVPLSGRQFLLAAATTAERLPEGTGAYWYTKMAYVGFHDGTSYQSETWIARDGRTWYRYYYRNPVDESASPSIIQNMEPQDTVLEQPQSDLLLGGAKVTIGELQALPTEPAALKARIAELVRKADIRTSAGKLTATQQREHVFQGLVSLVSLLPAPPSVRAAALRAIASYPNVTDIGAVDGGRGLLVSFYPGEPPARLVIDPRTGQVRRTNVLVLPFGGTMTSDGGGYAITAEWTDTLPR